MPVCRPSNRAFTLVEAMISAGLFVLVLAGAYGVLVLAFRFHNRLDDSVVTFQQALLASSRMSQAIGTGSQASVVQEGDDFAFVSASPVSGPFTQDASGQLQWHKFVFFYRDQDILYKGQVTFAPTSTLPPTPLPSLLRADTDAEIVQVAKGVTSLTLTTGSGASTVIRVEGEQARKNAITLETRVTFRQ